MLKKIFVLPLIAVLLTITVFAGVVKDGTLRANSDSNYITISWMSDIETGVARYVIMRAAGMSGSFMPIAELNLKGNGARYEYVDESAFRATSESMYRYQVQVVFSNAMAPQYYGPITVSHRTSDVRRTWGSIKAMFR